MLAADSLPGPSLPVLFLHFKFYTVPVSGTDLTDPAANSDNMFQRDWAELGFTTVWLQLSNYNNNFYFEGCKVVGGWGGEPEGEEEERRKWHCFA